MSRSTNHLVNAIPFSMRPYVLRWPSYRSTTQGALAIAAALFGSVMAVVPSGVYAQNQDATTPAHAQPFSRQRYDIPAGPLDQTLARFANESGTLVSSSPEQVLGRTSLGVQGFYSAQEALAALLHGTGLQAVPQLTGGLVLRALSDSQIGADDADDADDAGTLAAVTVVSAAGYAQEIKNASASISVVSSADLEKHRFSSLQDIAREIPGLSVIGAGEQSGISIRGMEKGYTLILVDGKRVRSETGNPRELNNEDLDSNFIPPLAAIERIEVIRGPMSSLYGSDAMGGVINIITKKTPETWSGSAGWSALAPDSGAMGKQRQKDVYLTGPIVVGVLGASLWANATDQDEDRYLGGYQESSKHNVGGKLRLNPLSDHEFILDYSKASQQYTGNPGAVLLPDVRRPIDRKWSRTAKGLSYNGGFELGVLELNYHQEDYERITFPTNAGFPTTATNKVADTRWVMGLDKHIMTLGAQWSEDATRNNELGGGGNGASGTGKVSEKALFGEDEWELISQTMFLTLGARVTDNAFFGSHVSPRSYLVFHHNDNWSFKGGLGSGFKSPKLAQLDSRAGSQRGGGVDQFLVVGNPNLRPEKSTNIELSAIYQQADTLRLGATVFHNNFSNKILNTSTFYFDDGQGGLIHAYCDAGAVGTLDCPAWATWFNARKTIIRGLELEGRWEASKTMTLKGNYTLTDSKVNAGDVTIDTPAGPRSFGETLALLNGNSLVGIPKHNGSVMLDYQPTASLIGFARVNYEGQISSVNFENISIDQSDKDLVTLDAGLRYSLNRNFSFNFGIDNITNNKRFRVNDLTGAYRYSERGRSYYAALKAQF